MERKFYRKCGHLSLVSEPAELAGFARALAPELQPELAEESARLESQGQSALAVLAVPVELVVVLDSLGAEKCFVCRPFCLVMFSKHYAGFSEYFK